MSAVVLIPWAGDDPEGYRSRALGFVRRRLIADGWPTILGRGTPGRDRWVKAGAVADAAWQAPGRPDDVLVVHDADVVLDLAALREAVAEVELGGAEWAIPHSWVHRLDEATTEIVLAGGRIPEQHGLARARYVGVQGGGCVVLRRSTYDDCPLDRRFVGWGDEDLCWGWALEALHGVPWRSRADLVHLWHPHASPGAQRGITQSSVHARRHYRAARRSAERMRAVVDAGRYPDRRSG